MGLSHYDVIVLDEVHERHLHGDFLLGIMKCIIHQRQDLKLVLMSATINIQLFSNYFAKEDVKVIQVSMEVDIASRGSIKFRLKEEILKL